jgi:hypothetical protein
VRKTASRKKRKAATKTDPVKSVDATATRRSQYRYEPYRKADPTPEPEGNCPSDFEDLQTLDATAKMIYKSDLEILEYIEALQGRTSAILEQVNRNDSQLRSGQYAMERIEQYACNWQKMDDHWTDQQLLGDGNFRAKWENGKKIILGSDESSDEEEGARCAEIFSLFWIRLTLRLTGTLVNSQQWFGTRTVLTPLFKSISPSMFDLGR